MIVRTQLGEWMESERVSKGLTKGKISDMIGISVGQYSAYVTGKSLPRAKTLEKIASAYKKPLADIRAMMAPVTPAVSEVVEVAPQPAVESGDSLTARIGYLEAKLDYAVKLIEQLVRK